jgi:hypothetical protein
VSRSRRGALTTAAAALTAAGVAVTLTACSTDAPTRPAGSAATSTSTAPPTSLSTATATAAATAAATAGVQRVRLSTPIDHAHGLVVSEDGSLLVGTHTGVMMVDTNGAAARVGTVADDLMGMTAVPGTGRLISSGHPGASSDMPNPLGLLSSADGGRSWTPMSLAGQVDFHALATDGDLIAGFDGVHGIRLSRDGGRTWTRGAAIAAAALAMTPGSVWATTEQGLQRSTDGGRSFSVVGDAPVLRLLASASDDSLWGVDLEGFAWRSPDGVTWQRRAAVGQVDAMAAADHETAYAITARQLHIVR